MKQITYFLSVLCAFLFLSSCAVKTSIQSIKLASYTAASTLKPHQKIMLVMHGNAGWDDFYNNVATEFTSLVEKEHEISVVYKVFSPMSSETQADIDLAIKAQKPDFIIDIRQGETNKTPVAIPITEYVATISYVEDTNFVLSLKNTEINQVFWQATALVNRSAIGIRLGKKLFMQLKKDGIIDAGGQLSMQ